MSDPMAPAAVTADRRPRTSWGWFVALGILMILLGAFAWYDIIGLTLAGTIFIGAALLVGGVFQVVHAFMDRSWGGFLLQMLAGILYCIGGLLIMREPVAGSLVITLVLAIVMIVAGCSRIVLAMAPRRRRTAAAGRAGEHRGWHRPLYHPTLVRPLGARHADRHRADHPRGRVAGVRTRAAPVQIIEAVTTRALVGNRRLLVTVTSCGMPACAGSADPNIG